MIIIYEGMDKVGKTTILKQMDHENGYKHINIDRGPAGYMLYDTALKRSDADRRRDNSRHMNELKGTEYMVVYLYADPAMIQRRLDFAKEDTPPTGHDFKKTMELYEEFVDMVYEPSRVVKIDTTMRTVSETCKLVMKKLKELENKQDWLKLDEKFRTPDGSYVEYFPSMNHYSSYDLNVLGLFNKDSDPCYYNMLRAEIIHMAHMRKLGWKNDRQMVITSSDCIPCIQMMWEKTGSEDGDLLHFTWVVNQRSLNLESNGKNDLLFFEWMAHQEELQREILGDEFGYVGVTCEVYYMVAVPHRYL